MADRVGLVLGAGGVGGAAFHAGTLLALAHDLGWDPRTADVVVGTSAGSIVATLLRAGLDTDDLAAWASQAPPRPDGMANRDLLEDIAGTPTRVRPRVSPRLVTPTVLRKVLTSEVHPLTALLALTPFGLLDAEPSLSRLDELVEAWPAEDLRIAAVRSDDGTRVVLSGVMGETVGQAVAASCAIPGVFNPVSVAGCSLVDGGAWSPTNADLLLDAGVDVAVVLSPMSGSDLGRLPTPDRLLRRMSTDRLRREVEALRATGVRLHVLEPSRDTMGAMGFNPLDREQAPGVIRQSFLDTALHVCEELASDLGCA